MSQRATQLSLCVQFACGDEGLPRSIARNFPTRSQIRSWVQSALRSQKGETAKIGNTAVRTAQITVRFVDEDEGRTLNRDYRGKNYATNVLSFPYEEAPNLMGDLVLCLPVLQAEAKAQKKTVRAHCAHLLVHGVLHLQGYDHETGDADAEYMEALECRILARLGFANPYAQGHHPG